MKRYVPIPSSQCYQVPHSILWFIYVINLNLISGLLKRQTFTEVGETKDGLHCHLWDSTGKRVTLNVKFDVGEVSFNRDIIK